MEKSQRICHDLKTDRPDMAQPLPAALGLLPIVFYLSIVAAIGLNAFFFMQLKDAETSKAEWEEKAKSEDELKLTVKSQQDSIDLETARANDVVKWIDGAHPLQPLSLAITRSMNAKSTISELSLIRDRANPDQIWLGLKFDKGGTRQLDDTLDAIQSLGYRYYAAVQTQGQSGLMDYQATLIKTGAGE